MRPSPSSSSHGVFVLHSLDVGGAQRSVITTASAWPSTTRCEIVAARGGDFFERSQGAATTRVMAEGWPNPIAVGRFMRRIQELVRREQPKALLTNSYGVTRIILLLRKLGGLRRSRIVVVEQNTLRPKLAGLYPGHFRRRIALLLTKWLYRSADALVGVSDGVSRDLEEALQLVPGSVRTIHNPVAINDIAGASRLGVPSTLNDRFRSLARPIIISAGRLVTAKAQADLLTAFARLPVHLSGSLVILGDGPLRGSLEQQAEALGIAERIWMPGFVDNPWWFIARADAFVLTSRWEGLPLILLEAVACGVPVVSTDCPSGPREILHGIERTRLTPVGDPESTAAAIEELLTQEAVETRAAEGLSRFEPSLIAEQYAQLISELPTG